MNFLQRSHQGLRFLAAIFLGLLLPGKALLAVPAGTPSPSGLWRETDDQPKLTARGVSMDTARRGVVPSAYRTLTLDRAALASLLAGAPREFAIRDSEAAVTEIELPIPASGDFARFAVEESPVMEDGLAARYPQIRTYLARGIDDPRLSARLDVTPQGFHGMIFSPEGQIFIDPYFADGTDLDTTIAYYKQDYYASKPLQCLVHSDPKVPREAVEPEANPGLPNASGASLRVYRLALATTGEYAAAVGNGTVTGTLSAVVTSINRVDALYERDFAIRMVLVNNEDQIIYTKASTDPYTNTNASSLLTENQSNCDSVIGAANYDIGHVFSTGGGGLAGLGVVCRAGNKARGETGLGNPTGDPYDIDYVAHEMGHQFGGNHTFNSTTNNCGGGNRSAGSAYEPGSGVTIMAYAGICSVSGNVQDLAPHSDDYFHSRSYTEINAYTTTGAGSAAFSTIATGNNPPTITPLTAYTIPLGTPFALTATANDANGDRLTYCWEEYDLGGAVNSTVADGSGTDNGAAPIFRSYAPTISPTRLFPSLPYILNNANKPPLRGSDGYLLGEALPSMARANGLNFRCTVRDNRAGGGGSDFALVKLTVATGAGPFAITAPNTTAANPLAGGSTQTVTWNVANTTASPVSCANVKITLSTDGGLTFPIILAASVPNSGTASVVLPNTGNVATNQGRIKVEAVGNIFFDISDANLVITSANTPPTFAASGSGITLIRGTPNPVSATVGSVTPGSNALTGVTVSGVPDGITLTPSIVNGNSIQLDGTAECRVTTTLTSRTYPVSITVTDAAGSTASGPVNVSILPNPAPTLGAYADASVPRNGSVVVSPSAGPADANFNLPFSPFTVLPTTLPGGGTIAVNQNTGAVTVTPNAASTLGATAVRVTCQDGCGAAVVKLFNVTVTAAVNIAPNFTSGAPPSTAVAGGKGYTYTFTASGTPAPSFAVTAGTLPPGLMLNGTSGVLSGTPTTPGVYPNITVSAGNGTAPNATQTFSITVTNSFANYAAGSVYTGPDAAPDANPTGDGLTNLLKYALNQPLDVPGRMPGAVLQDYSGAKYLSITFTRVPLDTDLTYLVESSPDLAAWTTVATSTGGAVLTGPGVVSDAGGTAPLKVEVRDTVAQDQNSVGQRRFLRLRVTNP